MGRSTKATRAAQRDAQVAEMMSRFFERAAVGDYETTPEFEQAFDVLFNTSSKGFREVMLVVAIARLLDPNYRAGTDFYACNPRPLYEHSIREQLKEKRVPRGQSGPLNVAKTTQALNAAWAEAKKRKERPVAHQVVNLIPIIEAMSPPELENFTVALLARFLAVAEAAADLNVTPQPKSDPATLLSICTRLINEQPDKGNTVQRVVGYLMQSYHTVMQTGIRVVGHEESASTTNKTSKKLADITEEQADTTILVAYEVTTKVFSMQRVDEAYLSIQAYNERTEIETEEVVVICRLEDVPEEAVRPVTSNVYFGYLNYQGVTFHFVNLYEWISSQLARMPVEARFDFYNRLHNYISEENTPVGVKQLWGQLQEQMLQ